MGYEQNHQVNTHNGGENMFGSKKKHFDSVEYQKVHTILIELRTELNLIKQDVARLETLQNSLRGLVNRKVGTLEDREKAVEEKKDLNNSIEYYM